MPKLRRICAICSLLLCLVSTAHEGSERSESVVFAHLTSEFTHPDLHLQHPPHRGLERAVVAHLWTAEEATKRPLIWLFPGRGVAAQNYQALAHELVQAGYGVLALDLPEIGHTTYLDGTVIEPSDAYRPGDLMRGPYELVDQFFQPAVDLGLQDVKLALQHVKQTQHPWHGFIDWSQIGVLGHSLGGRIGGAFAATHGPAIKAYASLEGIPPRAIRQQGMAAPQAHLVTREVYPYAQDNYQMLLDGASNRVCLTLLSGMNHNSMLAKELATLERTAQSNLKILAHHLKVFFDHHFKGTAGGCQSFKHPQTETRVVNP